jgi:hypothetical protein
MISESYLSSRIAVGKSLLQCAGLNRREGLSSGKLAHSVRKISPGFSTLLVFMLIGNRAKNVVTSSIQRLT